MNYTCFEKRNMLSDENLARVETVVREQNVIAFVSDAKKMYAS